LAQAELFWTATDIGSSCITIINKGKRVIAFIGAYGVIQELQE